MATFDPFELFRRVFLKTAEQPDYRKRAGERKFTCPHPDYPDAFIVLPAEWTGLHAIRKDRGALAVQDLGSVDITQISSALALCEGFGNIPGIENENIEEWKPELIPIPILSWVVETVLPDFASAYKVPKVSLPQSVMATKIKADGNLKKMRQSSEEQAE